MRIRTTPQMTFFRTISPASAYPAAARPEALLRGWYLAQIRRWDSWACQPVVSLLAGYVHGTLQHRCGGKASARRP